MESMFRSCGGPGAGGWIAALEADGGLEAWKVLERLERYGMAAAASCAGSARVGMAAPRRWLELCVAYGMESLPLAGLWVEVECVRATSAVSWVRGIEIWCGLSGRGGSVFPCPFDSDGIRLHAWAKRALRLQDLLYEAGLVSALVGGCVRSLLGGDSSPLDVDFVLECDVPSSADRIVELTEEVLGGAGSGVRSRMDRRFGTLSCDVGASEGADPPPGRFDFASARCENYPSPGELPQVVYPVPLWMDTLRRDFTLNSILLAGEGGGRVILDPHGGTAHLRNGVLRVLHPLGFVEDPSRVLRAARYCAQEELVADDDTRRWLRYPLERFGGDGPPSSCAYRLWLEWRRCLESSRPDVAAARLAEWGFLRMDEEKASRVFDVLTSPPVRCAVLSGDTASSVLDAVYLGLTRSLADDDCFLARAWYSLKKHERLLEGRTAGRARRAYEAALAVAGGEADLSLLLAVL